MEMIEKSIAKSISEIMACFDFDKCAKILEAIDSKFVIEGIEKYANSLDLREWAEGALWEAVQKGKEENAEEYFVEARGFLRAEFIADKEKPFCILSFIPERWGDL